MALTDEEEAELGKLGLATSAEIRDWLENYPGRIQLAKVILELHWGLKQAEENRKRFQRDVAEKAWEYAVRYNWCDQVKACLEELGTELGQPRAHFKVVVTYDVVAELPYDDLASLQGDGSTYLLQHINVPSLLITGGPLQVEDKEGFVDPEEIRVSEHELLPPSQEAH